MKKIKISFISILTVALFVPAVSFAETWINGIIQNAKAGNGTVIESHSSASTGGQTVKAGESVTTGESSASVHTETRVNNSGGEVKVKVETSNNGVVQKEEYSQQIKAGESVRIHVATTSQSGAAKTKVDVRLPATTSTAQVGGRDPKRSASSTQMIASTSLKIKLESTLSIIPNFFKRIFAFIFRF